jgi:hypothetical protein
MKSRIPLLVAAALLLAVGAVACSADVVAPPALDDAQIDADIAATSGDAVASQITSFGDNVAAAGSFSIAAPGYSLTAGGAGAALAGIPPTCTYASGRYSCAATTEQGLSVSRSFAFYNAQGQTVQNWDAAVVESVNFQAQVDGHFSEQLVWTAGVHRAGNVTVSGLISQTPQRLWNGTGMGDDTLSHVGLDGIRSLAGHSSVTVANVLMPAKNAASQTPISGSIAIDVEYTASLQGLTGSVSKDVSRHVVVTFNGTNAPTLQVGLLHCVLHLDTRSVDSCQ